MNDSKIYKRAPLYQPVLIKVYQHEDGGEFYETKGLCDWEVNENFVVLQKAFDKLLDWTDELESRLAKLEEKEKCDE